MADSPGLSEEDARRLLEAIENPSAVPVAAVEPEPVPEAVADAPPARGWAIRAAGRRRRISGGVMAVAGAAWLGVGAATLAALPCLLGGVFLVLGLWVLLGPAS